MSTKAHVLVVEDKSVIYKRLKMLLKENHYSVEKYCPSVEEAIDFIYEKRPDLVLLDINLQGEHNGIYLGKLLNEKYFIPFIYVTDLDDNQTFYEGLQTKQADFISKKKINLLDTEPTVINTKPHLDEQRLIRSIQTTLTLHKDKQKPMLKEEIMVYPSYKNTTKKMGNEEVSQIPLHYKDIAYITTNSEIVDEVKTKESNKTEYVKMKKDTLRVVTWNKKSYIYYNSLKSLIIHLPSYIIQVNGSSAINISSDVLDGRINGNKLKINNQIFEISRTFKQKVEIELNKKYLSSKKPNS